MTADILLAPLEFTLDPAKRIYWACLLSSALLASLAVAVQAGRFDLTAQLRSLLDGRYWLHASTATDVGMLFLNHATRVLVFVPAVGARLGATLVVGRFLQQHVGEAPELAWPWLVIASVYSVAFFVAEDASRFCLHLAMHRCPVLWRFHRLHHSARTLTPLTLFRVHPVEHALYFGRGVAVFGLVSGAAVWLFGRNLAAFDILGVGVFGFLFNLAGSNLRHSHVWLSFGAMERWFVSPAQHQLHHSRHHGHCNLGSALAIWDRMAGTAVRAGEPRRLEFGLPDADAGREAAPRQAAGGRLVPRQKPAMLRAVSRLMSGQQIGKISVP